MIPCPFFITGDKKENNDSHLISIEQIRMFDSINGSDEVVLKSVSLHIVYSQNGSVVKTIEAMSPSDLVVGELDLFLATLNIFYINDKRLISNKKDSLTNVIDNLEKQITNDTSVHLTGR